MKAYQQRQIIKYNHAGMKKENDLIATELRLRLSVNGSEVLSLLCSPVMIRELVTGLIMTEGLIKGNWCMDRMSIDYRDTEVIVDIPAEGDVKVQGGILTSGCVGGVTFERHDNEPPVQEGPCVEAEKLFELYNRFQRSSSLYNATGCIHTASVSDGKHLIVIAEDIGRHNAVDKAIGYCILEGIPLEDKIMLVSGRLSSEMVQKCSRWAIPIIISRTAPTLRAIEIAESRGITLIGFLRGRRFNIYSAAERILQNS